MMPVRLCLVNQEIKVKLFRNSKLAAHSVFFKQVKDLTVDKIVQVDNCVKV